MDTDLRKIMSCSIPDNRGVATIEQCDECTEPLCGLIWTLCHGDANAYNALTIEGRRKVLRWIAERPDLADLGGLVHISISPDHGPALNIYGGEREYFAQFPLEKAVDLMRICLRYRQVKRHVDDLNRLGVTGSPGEINAIELKDIFHYGSMIEQRFEKQAVEWCQKTYQSAKESDAPDAEGE